MFFKTLATKSQTLIHYPPPPRLATPVSFGPPRPWIAPPVKKPGYGPGVYRNMSAWPQNHAKKEDLGKGKSAGRLGSRGTGKIKTMIFKRWV